MNKPRIQQSRVPLRWVLATGIVLAFLAGCVTTSEMDGASLAASDGNVFRQIDDLMLVDCLLPGQIRQLGGRMTYLGPRRRIKTTKSDCGIRGGEFVLFDRADYRTALQTLLPKAQAGDPVAQTYVGEIYEKGLGLPAPDPARAAEWYRRAAESGHRPAQTNLGSLYERGLGVAENRATALDLYRRATGLTEDGLVFESRLREQQAEFEREIALRNRVAAQLRQQLQLARATPAPTRAPAPTTAQAPARPAAPAASAPARPETAVAAPVALPPPAVDQRELERVAESLRREAASEAERVQRELRAVQELKRADAGTPAGARRAAQVGKLELSLRQQSEALADNERRLGMVVQ